MQRVGLQGSCHNGLKRFKALKLDSKILKGFKALKLDSKILKNQFDSLEKYSIRFCETFKSN